MCGSDSAHLYHEPKPYDGPQLTTCRKRPQPTPLSRTIYPVTLAETPKHVDGDIIYLHKPFLCRAVQDFTGHPRFGERSLKRWELVMVNQSRLEWWYAMSDKTHGGHGWFPAMHLEKYGPDTDSSAYRDNSLDKQSGPIYFYNPFGQPEASIEKMIEFAQTFCNSSGGSVGQGVIGIELKDDGRDYDPTTFPSVFEGFPTVYKFERDRLAIEAANRARWEEKEEKKRIEGMKFTCQRCGNRGHVERDCLRLIMCEDCGQGDHIGQNYIS
ncbi:hypothetical protein N431DRAFT_517554 [Stipitochalara longipes BDJ]|nr:hypothetical protein N431DRAFT_517554 [Stipitochalara longipes BDJ]